MNKNKISIFLLFFIVACANQKKFLFYSEKNSTIENNPIVLLDEGIVVADVISVDVKKRIYCKDVYERKVGYSFSPGSYRVKLLFQDEKHYSPKPEEIVIQLQENHTYIIAPQLLCSDAFLSRACNEWNPMIKDVTTTPSNQKNELMKNYREADTEICGY